MADVLQSAVIVPAGVPDSSPVEAKGTEATQDPRIRRTRELLQQAFGKLLKEKDFDRISVQDITDAATVNRATFYAHYPDKFALLECKVAGDFNALLASRGVTFDGTCTGALRNIILGVCDFLSLTQRSNCERQRQMEPHLETAVVAVVRRMLLEGMKRHPSEGDLSAEVRSASISWAVLGAAREWVRSADREASEAFAGKVAQMVAPLLHATTPPVQ